MIQGVISILINNAGVQAAVGQNKLTDKYKVYPVACPQPEDDPYIVLTITGADPTQGKNCDANLDYVRVDVYCYGKKYKTSDDIHNAVRDALNFYSGTVEGYVFSNIYLDDYKDGWVDTVQLYARIATYKATVSRVIPT